MKQRVHYMTRNDFKDMIFAILKCNDSAIKDIDADDKKDCFIITCEDNSDFLIFIHDLLKQ